MHDFLLNFKNLIHIFSLRFRPKFGKNNGQLTQTLVFDERGTKFLTTRHLRAASATAREHVEAANLLVSMKTQVTAKRKNSISNTAYFRFRRVMTRRARFKNPVRIFSLSPSLPLSLSPSVSISLSVCLSLQTSSRKNGTVITSAVETVWEMICSDAPATQTVVRAHKMRNMILLQAPGHTPFLKKYSTAYWCCGMRRFRRRNSRLEEKNEAKHLRIFPLWALQEMEHFFKRWLRRLPSRGVGALMIGSQCSLRRENYIHFVPKVSHFKSNSVKNASWIS